MYRSRPVVLVVLAATAACSTRDDSAAVADLATDTTLARLSLTLIGPFLAGPKTGAKTLVALALDPLGEELRGQYLEKAKPVEPSAQAQDDRLAAELWERSAALTLGGGTGDPVVAH